MTQLSFSKDGKVTQIDDTKKKMTKASINKMSEQEAKFELNILVKEFNKLQKKYEDLLVDYRKETGKTPKPFQYVLSNYSDGWNLIVEICNKHHCQIRNRIQISNRIIEAIEGNKISKPMFTYLEFLDYLSMINYFSLDEYRLIKFAPYISSPFSIFDKYTSILGALKPIYLKKTNPEF